MFLDSHGIMQLYSSFSLTFLLAEPDFVLPKNDPTINYNTNLLNTILLSSFWTPLPTATMSEKPMVTSNAATIDEYTC